MLHSLPIVHAAIITNGNVSPGPIGTQPDPWNAGLLAVGISGNGSLIVNNGSVLNTTTSFVALNNGSAASFLFSGPGTTWNNISTLSVGDSGIATAVIEDGALVDIGSTVIMGNNTAGTTVLIGSTNSSNPATLRVGTNLYLGGNSAGPNGGTAAVTVATGGLLQTLGQTYIYTGSSIDPGPGGLTSSGIQLNGGKLTSTSPLSTLNLDNTGDITGSGTIDVNVYMGANGLIDGGSGEALMIDGTIAGSGTIQGAVLGGNIGVGDPITNLLGDPLTVDRIAGSLVFHDVIVSAATVFDFGIHGTNSNGFDQLVLTGDDHLAGIAQIAFVQGFEPDLADTFQLINFQAESSTSGWFSSIAAPGNWHLSQEGLLYHTPEPGAALIALLGCMFLCCQQRILTLRLRRS